MLQPQAHDDEADTVTTTVDAPPNESPSMTQA